MKKKLVGIVICTLLFTSALSATGVTVPSEANQEPNSEWIDIPYEFESDELLEMDVTIEIEPYNPPITIPASGGNFQYTITVANNEATRVTFDVWTVAILPSGNPYGPVFGPVSFHLPDGWSSKRDDLSRYVPALAPPGKYTYIARVGIYPSEFWDSDSFTFEKLSESVGWYPQVPGASYALTGVDFPDVDNGWAVSTYEEIIHTRDGGDTWYAQDDQQPYPHSYNDVCFVDTQTG